ncbi:hypothetical protein PIB30_027904 [Stylosanthes scabra]|uniref:Protein unc-45 homolog B n=1 Tax=Stylosanthes scabra TaxID=79078 RepID=A0ABU6Z8F1_9FABA|nr:hypothetical protein [Stylosanthes scabra]
MKKKRANLLPKTAYNTSEDMMSDESHSHHHQHQEVCLKPCCFFCTMREPDASLRRVGISNFFREMPLCEDKEDHHHHVLVLSELWHIAMTQPNNPEFPSLGIFKFMANLINKAINDKTWLLTNQNIYIPYYAAHIIGSYTMNKEEFAQIAVQSGVIPPLLELLRGKISWVEQRVAVRALGHLASYESTFDSVSEYEQEVVKVSLNLASTCLEVVYSEFVGVKKRVEYQRNLLTRGVGDLEMENRKAEEWGSQLQCWCLHLLNCFAFKERCLDLICQKEFLKELCNMWGGLVNHTSPGGIGLLRILCYSKFGRKIIADTPKVIINLGNVSRSSDDWQYMGIDCLLLLLKDSDTRFKVIDIAASYLVDLVEFKSLGDKSDVGETITKVLLEEHSNNNYYYKHNKLKFNNRHLQEVLDLKVYRRKKEKALWEEKLEERRVLVGLIKQEANHMFRLGKVEAALVKYSEALEVCPLRLRKERMVLYSNKAQCNLVLKNPESAISDSTRALCLSNPANRHMKSLWRRSQAYDMKGMAKESLLDCIMFMNTCIIKSKNIPYHAARMICKQMDATWLFAAARSKINHHSNNDEDEAKNCEENFHYHKSGLVPGLSTIIEEPFVAKEESRRKVERARRRIKEG